MSEPTPEQQIQGLRAELDAARAALGDFAYVISHDLRAQLRHVQAYGALLREELQGKLAGDAAHFLDVIGQAAELMGRQIDGLREWAQLDRVELQPMPIETAALLGEVRQALAPQTHGRAVQWRVAANLPPLQGDGALLRQLFTHVLSNALKFTRPREMAVIEIGVEFVANGMAVFFVRDNGVGYNAAQQDKLFHVFQRLHGASQFEGLGLGLALACKIAQRHGGGLAMDGAPDAGCRVRMTLPVAV